MYDRNLKDKLDDKKTENSLRKLPFYSEGIDFSSNDYLGLARNFSLKKSIISALENDQEKLGSTGSRLLTGNSKKTEKLEESLATLFKSEAALIFNSGYTANLSVLSSVPTRHDTILYDADCHASIKDGLRLSLAKHYSFQHNHPEDLLKKLANCTGNVFVVVESLYSMDGSIAPLKDFATICKAHGCALIVDEAHSTGIYGLNGSGLVCENHLEEEVFARIMTFGKGIGFQGACVVGSEVLKQYLINFARPFIYTTATSPADILHLTTIFDHLKEHPEYAPRLFDVIEFFRKKLNELSLNGHFLDSKSAIQALIVSGNHEVKHISSKLNEAGFHVFPILSPTVEKGKERIRICLHEFNTEKEITDLLHHIVTIIHE